MESPNIDYASIYGKSCVGSGHLTYVCIHFGGICYLPGHACIAYREPPQLSNPIKTSPHLLALSSSGSSPHNQVPSNSVTGIRHYNILRISCSPRYFSSPESRWSHHSYSILSQMSLNHGVNLSEGSLNMVFRSSWET